MSTRIDNTENTAEEFRQAAKRLGRGAIYLAKAIPLGTTVKRLDRGVAVAAVVIYLVVKGTWKLAINILRYSMGLSIYGLIIWPYRFLAPLMAVLTVAASNLVEDDDDADWFGGESARKDHSMFPPYVDEVGNFTLDPNHPKRSRFF